jgi:hypothetical protein
MALRQRHHGSGIMTAAASFRGHRSVGIAAGNDNRAESIGVRPDADGSSLTNRGSATACRCSAAIIAKATAAIWPVCT